MKRAVQMMIVVAVTLLGFAPGGASAASLTVKTTVRNNAIELGQATALRISISGLTQQERNAGTLIFRAAPFPYKSYRSIGTISAPRNRERFTVSPQTNTRIRVVFSAGLNIRLTSRPVTVYVNPISRGGRQVETRRGTRYLPGSLTFPRSVLARWQKTPRKIRTVYYYQQCQGSSFYKLRASKPIRATVGSDRMKVLIPGFSFTFKSCAGKPYWSVAAALGKLPGYLPNGDDGAGEPSPNARLYRRWVKWAGRKRIPARLIDPVFYR